MNRGTKSALVCMGIVCIAMSAVIFVGRKSGIGAQETVSQNGMDDSDYYEFGNEQGAAENGGYQVYLAGRGTVIHGMDNTMYCFDEDPQELEFFCTKSGCLHTGGGCPARYSLLYLLSYSSAVYGASNSARNEIWKCQDNEVENWYRADNDIIGLWGYREYLYYMTEFGVYRFPIEDPSEVEQVLDKPVLYEMLNFYEDKMYFVTEDEFLYEAFLDGSEKRRMIDEKALFPQICDGILYYRSAEYDRDGVFQQKNTLKGISLEDGSVENVLDAVYLYYVVAGEKKIYYTELPVGSDYGVTSLNVLDLNSGTVDRIVEEDRMSEIAVFPESDWIIYLSEEGEEDERYYYYCCVKKDGSERRRLEYPKGAEG